MTYNVFSGTLNPTQSINQSSSSSRRCCFVERREEDAAGKDLQVADRERLRGSRADRGRDQQRQDVTVGRAVVSVLHADSSQLRPPATSDHRGQRHAEKEDGHAHGDLPSTASFVTSPAGAATKYWPDCKPEGPLFSAEFVCESVCLSVCVSVCL